MTSGREPKPLYMKPEVTTYSTEEIFGGNRPGACHLRRPQRRHESLMARGARRQVEGDDSPKPSAGEPASPQPGDGRDPACASSNAAW